MENLTETIYTRHAFTNEELLGLSQKMAGAEAAISRKLEELKSMSTTIKADMAVQEGILHGCAEKLRSGYEMRARECLVDYNSAKGMVKYIDKETGEMLEERAVTQDEQLRLSGKITDAEQIIREASEEE